MNKICTSLEQSKKLLELGINEDTSDMVYLKSYFLGDGEEEDDEEDYDLLVGSYHEGYAETDDGSRIPLFVQHVPAWSLSALLDIIKNRKDCNKVEFFTNYASKWVLTTTYYDSVWKEKEIIVENSVDAVFEMICWLKEK